MAKGEERAFFTERISLSALFATLASPFCDLAASRFSLGLARRKSAHRISTLWRRDCF